MYLLINIIVYCAGLGKLKHAPTGFSKLRLAPKAVESR